MHSHGHPMGHGPPHGHHLSQQQIPPSGHPMDHHGRSLPPSYHHSSRGGGRVGAVIENGRANGHHEVSGTFYLLLNLPIQSFFPPPFPSTSPKFDLYCDVSNCDSSIGDGVEPKWEGLMDSIHTIYCRCRMVSLVKRAERVEQQMKRSKPFSIK